MKFQSRKRVGPQQIRIAHISPTMATTKIVNLVLMELEVAN